MNGHLADSRSSTIRATVDMTMADSTVGLITTELHYRTLDPFAVTIVFSVADCPAVEWVCARDLFREGLAMPAGAGDVRVQPDGDHLIIDLHSPSGSARLVADHAEMSRFVRRMLAAVPEGREGEFYSLDSALEFGV